jgi:acyl-CoA thioester hydrolase
VTRESSSRVRVRYAETDQMGVAWHGNVFAWFEVGRTDLLRDLGTTYRSLEESEGLRLPVVEAGARYLRPFLYDDVVEVRTRVSSHSGARVAFAYELHREDDESEGPLVTGFTAHAAVDGTGRPRRLPPALRRLLS